MNNFSNISFIFYRRLFFYRRTAKKLQLIHFEHIIRKLDNLPQIFTEDNISNIVVPRRENLCKIPVMWLTTIERFRRTRKFFDTLTRMMATIVNCLSTRQSFYINRSFFPILEVFCPIFVLGNGVFAVLIYAKYSV